METVDTNDPARENTMNAGLRVTNTIAGKPVTPIPRGELVIDRAYSLAYLRWRKKEAVLNAVSDLELAIQCAAELRLDIVCVQSGETLESGSILRLTSSDIRPLADAGFFVFWIVDGPFQTLMAKRGMMELMVEIARSPEVVGRELKDLSHRARQTMAAGVAAGAHGIILADDIAYSRNTLVSPDFVKMYLLPCWQSLVQTAGELDVPLFYHSDGNLNSVLSHIVAAGFHGLQCLEPAAGMDLPAIRNQYPDGPCLMGNIDPALLVEKGTEQDQESRRQQIEAAVDGLLAVAQHRGGLVFGTCSGLDGGMSPEWVQTMYDLAFQ